MRSNPGKEVKNSWLYHVVFLHIDRKSKNQLLEEAAKIVKKYCELKKDGYHGVKLLSICPTNLHWMAILNDSKAIEVNIKSYYHFVSAVKIVPLNTTLKNTKLLL